MGCTTGSPEAGDFQPGKAPAPPTAEVSSPRLLPPPESPPGLPRVTQSRARIASPPTTHRSARRNYRIACARLMRSNYPPPLSSRRSAALGQRAVISCPSPAPELSPPLQKRSHQLTRRRLIPQSGTAPWSQERAMRPHLGWAEERSRPWGDRPGGLKM